MLLFAKHWLLFVLSHFTPLSLRHVIRSICIIDKPYFLSFRSWFQLFLREKCLLEQALMWLFCMLLNLNFWRCYFPRFHLNRLISFVGLFSRSRIQNEAWHILAWKSSSSFSLQCIHCLRSLLAKYFHAWRFDIKTLFMLLFYDLLRLLN